MSTEGGRAHKLVRKTAPAMANVWQPDDDEAESDDDNTDGHIEAIDISPSLTPENQARVRSLFHKYHAVFNARWGLLKPKDGGMRIRLRDPQTPPLSVPPYRMSPREQKVVDDVLDELVKLGRVEPSKSAWSSPVFVVKKNPAKPRMVIDYQAINNLVVRDVYPLPKQDEILALINGKRFVTSFDLTKGFYQIPIHPDDRHLTAFATHRGLEQLSVCIMGYTNSPAYFQRQMDSILRKYLRNGVVAYVDDLIVYSDSLEEHLMLIEFVLRSLSDHGLTLSASKTHAGYESLKVLGHRVGRLGLSTLDEKVCAMEQLPAARTLQDLEHILGYFGYYRHFVPRFAMITQPLADLKKSTMREWHVTYKGQPHPATSKRPTKSYERLKKEPIQWTDECTKALDHLKKTMRSAVALAPVDWKRPFVLYTDASYDGLGVALHQADGPPGSKKERPLVFLSRRLKAGETKYSPTELECSAVVWGVHKLCHFLDGSETTLVTDHSALTALMNGRLAACRKGFTNHRLLRWQFYLSQFDIKIVHREGRLHSNVDALSRMPRAEEQPDSATVLPVQEPLFLEDGGETSSSQPSTAPTSEVGEEHDTFSSSEVLLGTPEEWEAEYKADRSLRKVYKTLDERPGTADPIYHAFTLHRETCRLYMISAGPQPRLCLPVGRLAKMVDLAHNERGHQGYEKVFAALQKLFYAPGMARMVRNKSTNCAQCREMNTSRRTFGELQPFTAQTPFEIVAMDFVTAMPIGSSDFDAFTTITDKFTKVVTIYGCRKDDGAEMTADRFYNHYYLRYGLPQAILSDRDTRFTGQFWTALRTMLKVDKLMSTSYRPQTDGQSERSNQTVEAMLRHYVDSSLRNWADHLKTIEFVINTSPHVAIAGHTPYELLYGSNPRNGMDMYLTEHLQHRTRLPTTRQWMDLRILQRDMAVDALELAKTRMASYYDRDHVHQEFKRHDLVLMRARDFRSGRNRKIGPQRVGPFRVIERVGKNAYRLDLPGGYLIHPVIHVSKLLPAVSELSHRRPPTTLTDAGRVFEIDGIIGERKVARRGQTSVQYLLRFSGWSADEDQWASAQLVRTVYPGVEERWLQRPRASVQTDDTATVVDNND